MTDKEKLKKLKKLADTMYYAAQYLTTDASMLHKAMDEYRQFIIHEWREEPVSEQNLSNVERTVKNWKEPVSDDLGEYINELSKQFPEVSFAKLSRIAVRVAKWKEEQDKKKEL